MQVRPPVPLMLGQPPAARGQRGQIRWRRSAREECLNGCPAGAARGWRGPWRWPSALGSNGGSVAQWP
eukprot:15430236-Alexandrium_andersonii.AAC.1